MGPTDPAIIRENLEQLAGWAKEGNLPHSWLTAYRLDTTHIAELPEPVRSELRQLADDVVTACRDAELRGTARR